MGFIITGLIKEKTKNIFYQGVHTKKDMVKIGKDRYKVKTPEGIVYTEKEKMVGIDPRSAKKSNLF